MTPKKEIKPLELSKNYFDYLYERLPGNANYITIGQRQFIALD